MYVNKYPTNTYCLVIVCLGQTESGRKVYVATNGKARYEFALTEEQERSFSKGMESLEELIDLLEFRIDVCYPYYPSYEGAIKEHEIKQLQVSLQEIAYRICVMLGLPRTSKVTFKPKKKYIDHGPSNGTIGL